MSMLEASRVLVRSDPNGPDDSPVNKRDSKPLSILDSKAIVGSCTSSSVGAAEFCAIKSIPDVAEPIIKPSETEEDISGVLGLESESDDDMESLDFNVKLMGELTGELMDTGLK